MKLLKYLAEEVARQKINIACKENLKEYLASRVMSGTHMCCGKSQSDNSF